MNSFIPILFTDLFHIVKILSFKTHLNFHTRETVGGTIDLMCNRGNCMQKFSKFSHLQAHINLHDNILEKCELCPWRGNTSGVNIKLHYDRHLGIKEHVCDICGKKFTQKSNRRIHFEQMHERKLT